MGKIIFAVAILVLPSGLAAANDKVAVMAIAHEWADICNMGRNSQLTRRFVRTMRSLVDDFPPHVWQGSRACAAKTAITDAEIALGKIQQLEIDSGYGYLVARVTLTFRKAGTLVKLKTRASLR